MTGRGLLIFDLDGTLFRTETVTVPAVQDTFREHGLPAPSREEILPVIGMPGREYEFWLRDRCPETIASEFVETVFKREMQFAETKGELYPGVRDVLERLLSLQFRLAICTNGPQSYVDIVFGAHRLDEFFALVRCRRSDDDNKQLMVKELLDQSVARPAMMIGDRFVDFDAARQNGIPSIGATYGYGLAEEYGNADLTVASVSELPAAISTVLDRQAR